MRERPARAPMHRFAARARIARLPLLALYSVLIVAGCGKAARLGDPLDGLTGEQRDQFARGQIQFNRIFTAETGLGPLFNAASCAECHGTPVPGGPGDEVVLHVAAFSADGFSCDPLVGKGGPVIQQRGTAALKAALGIEGEPLPAEAMVVARRSTPDVFGLGLLDAIPDTTLLLLADPKDQDGDGISGRPNRFFDGRIGRFGRKAHVPTLTEFNLSAFLVEQGITVEEVPDEETIGGEPVPDGVDRVADPEIDRKAFDFADAYVRYLAPPPPAKLSGAAKRGKEIFAEIGCAACHVPTLKTGDHPVEALRRKEVAAYTDLLLHDMGPDLADICTGLATASEFRTEPLMGLRLSGLGGGERRFLHDGRARSIEEAIRLHGGEAETALRRFLGLSEKDRAALLEFLGSL